MLIDIWTVMRKEIKELVVAHAGRPLMVGGGLLLLLMLGVLMPWFMGRLWLEVPLVFWVWVLLPVPLVIVASAESFAGERERHTLETLLASPLSDRAIVTGKILAAMLYGWVSSLAVLLLGLVTVNLVHTGDSFLLYPPVLGAGSLSFGLLASALTACIGVRISLRVGSVRQAKLTHSLLALILLFGLGTAVALAVHFLPAGYQLEVAQLIATPTTAPVLAAVALALLLADATFYLAAAASFRRTHLLAD